MGMWDHSPQGDVSMAATTKKTAKTGKAAGAMKKKPATKRTAK
jgi:hypothetical protein